MIYSFGYRHGKPSSITKNDLVIDVRVLFHRNPYHNKKLRGLRGDNKEVIKDIEKTPKLQLAYNTILDRVKDHLTHLDGDIYIACTGGHHRSVYVADRLSRDLDIPVTHLNYNDR